MPKASAPIDVGGRHDVLVGVGFSAHERFSGNAKPVFLGLGFVVRVDARRSAEDYLLHARGHSRGHGHDDSGDERKAACRNVDASPVDWNVLLPCENARLKLYLKVVERLRLLLREAESQVVTVAQSVVKFGILPLHLLGRGLKLRTRNFD